MINANNIYILKYTKLSSNSINNFKIVKYYLTLIKVLNLLNKLR